jgi:hypothetical protein
MNKYFITCLLFLFLLMCSSASAQEPVAKTESAWSHSLAGWFYIMKDDFIFSPVYRADKDWLHLEARYNYEDMNTFSAWFGYTFSGGNKFQFSITPMVGGLVGNTNGMAPGLEFDFKFYGFEWYSESEYVFDFQEHENDFYYNWTDLTYSPIDWLWFGLSAQRTRLYQTDLEIQRGLILGGGYRWFGLSAYLFNIGFDDPLLVLSLSVTFPED